MLSVGVGWVELKGGMCDILKQLNFKGEMQMALATTWSIHSKYLHIFSVPWPILIFSQWLIDL